MAQKLKALALKESPGLSPCIHRIPPAEDLTTPSDLHRQKAQTWGTYIHAIKTPVHTKYF